MSESKYQTFGQRWWAGVIDGLLLLPIGVVNAMIISGPELPWLTIAWLPFGYSLYWFYSVLGHGCYGQTVGKHLMKVRVVDNGTEQQITMWQAVLRDSGIIVANTLSLGLGLCWAFNNELANSPGFQWTRIVLGYATLAWALTEIGTCLFNNKRRALHDLIAGTVVVKLENQ